MLVANTSLREYNVLSKLKVTVSVAASTVVRFLPPLSVRVFPSVMLCPPPESPAAVNEVIGLELLQTTPLEASVERILQDGKARFKPPAETLSPPAKVEVPEPVRLMIPFERNMPSVMVTPPVELSPAVEMPPVKVEVPVPVTVSVDVEVNGPVFKDPVMMP